METVEETRQSSRSTRDPERFTDTEHSSVFFQEVIQYQNIGATMSTKQYGMKAGRKVFGDAGLAAVASEIRDNIHKSNIRNTQEIATIPHISEEKKMWKR